MLRALTPKVNIEIAINYAIDPIWELSESDTADIEPMVLGKIEELEIFVQEMMELVKDLQI